MLKIKLFPKGKKHQRTFRVVVAEARSKFNGQVVADLGFYTPQTKTTQINQEELQKWVKNGAQITLGVDKLLHPDKYVRPPKVKAPKVAKVEEVKTEVAETPAEVQPVEEAVSNS